MPIERANHGRRARAGYANGVDAEAPGGGPVRPWSLDRRRERSAMFPHWAEGSVASAVGGAASRAKATRIGRQPWFG